MDKPPAYSGDESYVFVSYAHADADAVYAEMRWLHDQGFNVWYDEGIEVGSVWSDDIARAIERASFFLFFVTPNSVESDHCRREVQFAIDHGATVVAVHLEPTEVRAGLQLYLGPSQAILRHELTAREYRRRLIESTSRHLARGVASVDAPAPARARAVIPGAVVVALPIAALLVGGAVGWWAQRPAPVASAVTRFDVPLRSDRHHHDRLSFRLAPDGRRVVFLAEAASAGRSDLYVWDLEALEPTLLLENGPAHQPFFSADGLWIAYRDGSAGDFKKLPVAGGAPVTISPSGHQPNIVNERGASWGPNGKIVFANATFRGLRRVDASGGLPETLTDPPVGVSHGWPEFLPDGRAVLFHERRRPAETFHVAVLDLETGDQTILVEGSEPHFAAERLFFRRDASIWAVAFDPDQLAIVGEPQPVFDASFHVDIAYSGDLLYRSTSYRQSRFVWIDREGVDEPLPLPPGRYEAPRIAPDGSTFAFSLITEGSRTGDLWLHSLADGTTRRLTNDRPNQFMPAWNPDGQSIAFGVDSPAGGEFLYRLSLAGDVAPERLYEPGGAIRPAVWTDDGILYTFFHEGGFVGAFDLEAGTGRLLLDDDRYIESRPALSNDGRWLAFQSDRSGRFEIHVRPYPDVSAAIHQVSFDGGTSPAWGPDGALYYRTLGNALMRIERNGAPDRPFSLPATVFEDRVYRKVGTGRNFDIAADGRFLFLEAAADDAPPLTFVQNWLVEVDPLVPAR